MLANSVMLSDSYKFSHFDQYPANMTAMQSYMEARGGEYKKIIFYGIEYYIHLLTNNPPTNYEINQAQRFAIAHGIPFNYEGFNYIQTLGYWPVKISAKGEGSVCVPGEVLMTIESTDPKCAWVVNFLETMLMKLWYPCTVASKAYHVREILTKWYKEAGADLRGIDFAYHNFGDRGSSSIESAAIGGAAHLTSFKGTDNFHSLLFIEEVHPGSSSEIGYSIPATEHSTVTSWGKENEFAMMEHYLESNKGKPMIACVMDSYNIYNAVEYVTTALKTRIESNEYPTWIIRPDSGNPLDVIPSIFSIMEKNKVSSKQENGFKLFDKYRIIWGDGIDPEAIDKILELVVSLGYSPANLAFGSGGDLMQKVNRDTCKFAIKCCAIQRGGEWLPVSKEPLHDGFKKSKGGYMQGLALPLYYNNGPSGRPLPFNMIRQAVLDSIV